MIKSLLIACVVIVGLMVLWLAVQQGWRQLFADQLADEDVLAGRRGCGNCGCTSACTTTVASHPSVSSETIINKI
ncbi:MAG: hypothetical protein DA408_04565 [Bacteroidetes bacterium]|nr:MAG: hypothetical protein C7N36_09390 [Bacteroidota bacterium]PTM14015.1 MAG: hypothetical protein DA408_04565 [Bacteroidota bacterium]